MAYEKELTVARDVVQKAGEIQVANQSKLKEIELKSDMSPVTEIDRQCEQLICDTLLAAFPQDGFVGEAVVIKSSESALLDKTARAAALKNKYKPGMFKGKPVACWVPFKVEFVMEGKG